MPLFGHIFIMPALLWYHNLSEKLKKKVQIAQNKCIRICLKLYKIHHISRKEFESINWLLVNKRFHQCKNAITFRFVNNVCPHYLNDVYEYAPQCRIESRINFAKLKVPFRKTSMGQNGHSNTGPSLRNNLPGSLKKITVLSTFKHNLKKKYLRNLAGS